MGRSKAMLPVAGTTLLIHVVRTVQSACDPVVVSARRGQELPPLPDGIEIVWDGVEDFGPLAGIAAGFSALAGRCETALIIACDYAFAKPHFLQRLVDSAGGRQAVMVEHQGHLHPLLACYHLSMANLLRQHIDSGRRRVLGFAEACDPLILEAKHFADIDDQMISVKNLNYPADWNEAKDALNRGLGPPVGGGEPPPGS